MTTRGRLRLVAALALIAAGCGGSGDSGGPAGVAPDARDPAGIPDGAGTATIDMAGTWEIAAFSIEQWDSWFPFPAVADLAGQRFSIRRAGAVFELASFGWIPELDVASTFQGNWSVGWSRNVGDGRLLLFAFSGSVTTQVVMPAGVRFVPSYTLGIALGAIQPDEMLGRCYEGGGVAGLHEFTFLARRAGAGPVVGDARDPATAPSGTGDRSIDMAGEWEVTSAELESYEPALQYPGGGPPPMVGASFAIAARDGGFQLESFGWHAPIGAATPSRWNVSWARNEGDGRRLIYARNAASLLPGAARGRPTHRLGVALGAVRDDEVCGQYVEFGGPSYSGTFAFTFTARRAR